MHKRFSRAFIMMGGILTVMIILLSQSFYHPVEKNLSKGKEERRDHRHGDPKIVNVPGEVVPSATVALDKNIPTLLKSLISTQKREKTTYPEVRIFTSYFKTLFRAIISPNAP
jgi:hypothetical protein